MRTALLILSAALILTTFVPGASAERVTGCLDGDFSGDDCVVGDFLPCDEANLDCVIKCVRECGPPSLGD